MEEETATAAVLESMGANDYEAKVPALLAEFMRRESMSVTLMNRLKKGEETTCACLSRSKSIGVAHTDIEGVRLILVLHIHGLAGNIQELAAEALENARFAGRTVSTRVLTKEYLYWIRIPEIPFPLSVANGHGGQDSGDLVKASRCHSVRHPGLNTTFVASVRLWSCRT
jgi:hypothetical protein